MSDPGPQPKTPQQRQAKYLSRMLQMDPTYVADDIIALRAKALGIKRQRPSQAAATTPDAGLREKAIAELKAIRGQVWKDSPKELAARLKKLPTEQYPDIRIAAERLETIVTARPLLPALSSHKHFDGDFFSCFKQVLVQPAKETGVLREQVLASFRKRENRKKGRRMITLLKNEMPKLYQLEENWLESLLRQRKKSVLSGATQETAVTSSASEGIPWWVWWIGGVIIFRVIRALATSS